MEKNRPAGRKRTYGNGSADVKRRGSGLGTGPVGSQDGYAGRKNAGGSGTAGSGSFTGDRGPGRNPGVTGGSGRGVDPGFSGGRGPYRRRPSLLVIIVLVIALLGGGGGLSTVLGTDSSGETDSTVLSSSGTSSESGYASQTGSQYSDGSGSTGSSTSSSSSSQAAGASGSYAYGTNYASVNYNVADGARDKFTKLSGNGQDTVTMMVYMCGADLESKNGMATRDLSEMAAAATDNINLIVYTGGAKQWNNQIVSNQVNQIYQVTGGGLRRLDDNVGDKVMTDPATLTSFIQYCSNNYPADRNILIFWDHGGGSVSGYGYDEKHASSGAMSLSEIDKALTDGGMQFDFVGFDACLMATAENALMLGDHADYLIASEESEPGIGWYYTNWVNMLNEDTGISTLKLGQQIADDFVSTCARSCPGQKTTMSVVDLAETAATVPSALSAFANSTTALIDNKEYKTVSNARYQSREFAAGNGIDMVDLTDLAKKMGTAEGSALADVLVSAVKYNRTSTNITNAYGLSVYFPYASAKYVDAAVQNYEAIGMDDSYARCIQEFANLETSGQIAAGGSQAADPFPMLQGIFGGTSYGGPGGSSGTSDLVSALLEDFLSSGMTGIDGLSSSNTGFMSGRSLSTEEVSEYIAENHFDAEDLAWTTNSSGQHVLVLPDEQWDLVQELDLNLFVRDGDGYIDLGLDNVYDWDDDGNLIGDTDGTWLTIDGQVVAYYHLDTTADDSGDITTGRVPAYLNGDRVNLILVFDKEHPEGYIAGAAPVYTDGETETVAKNLTELAEGDELQFLCDYYDSVGNYQDSYLLGDALTVDDDMPIRNVKVNGTLSVMYRLTDIYNQEYWTPVIEQ